MTDLTLFEVQQSGKLHLASRGRKAPPCLRLALPAFATLLSGPVPARNSDPDFLKYKSNGKNS